MKPLFFSLVLLAFLSCADQSTSNKKNFDNQKFVEAYFTHFNNHSFDKMAAMYAEEADFKDPTLGAGIVKQTRQQTIDKYVALQRIFPNLRDSVIRTYVAGDNHVIVEFVSSGASAEGMKFNLPICTILTIENGLITKDFTYFDNFEEPDTTR